MASPRPRPFAAVLRAHRLAAGLTQEALAARAGLSADAVGVLERGQRRTPHRDTVALLADALGLAGPERDRFDAAAHPDRAPTAPPAAPPAGPSDPRLVGRARELIRLGRSLAGEGPPLLLLAGEPGIGKTRLLQEAAGRAGDAGWTVLPGGSTRRSGQEPYAPVLGALARFVAACPPAALRADLEGCGWLVRLLPELAERAVVPAPAWTLPPEQERRLMVAALARFLANVAGPAGTLLVLDDVQWAGPDALDLLADLLRADQEGRLRALVAYRSTEVAAGQPLATWLADLAREGVVEELALGPLARDEAREMVAGLMREDDAEGERAARIVERAGGIPFFLASCAQERPQGPGEGGGSEPEVPWTVRQSVRQRVAALPEAARALLGLAAVAGRELARPELLAAAAAALAADRATVLGAVEVACAAGLLAEDGRGSYRLAHDLVREALLADLGAARRAAWHLVWAEALERDAAGGQSERAAELAWHFAAGDAPARALPHALAAGDRAEAAYAHAEAERHYATATELAHAVGDRAREAEAFEHLGGLLSLLMRDDEAQRALEAAVALYRHEGNLESERRASARLAETYRYKGMRPESEALIRSLLKDEAAGEPSVAVARLYLELAWQHLGEPEGLAACERATEIARATGDARLLGDAEFQRGNTLEIAGRHEEAMRVLEEIVPTLEATGHLRRLGYVLAVLADAYYGLGMLGPMRRLAQHAVEVAEQVGVPYQVARMVMLRGYVAYLAGDWTQAQADLVRAVSRFRDLGTPPESAQAVAYLGQLVMAQGEEQQAMHLLEEAIALAQQRGTAGENPTALWLAHGALAEQDLLAGRTRAAEARLAPLPERLAHEPNSAHEVMPLLAWAHVDLGQEHEAASWLARALEWSSPRPVVAGCLCIRARLAMRQGRWREAEADLEECLALARAMPHPYAEAKALYVYGQLHAARGAPARARERYERALAILARLGERPYAERVERALAAMPSS